MTIRHLIKYEIDVDRVNSFIGYQFSDDTYEFYITKNLSRRNIETDGYYDVCVYFKNTIKQLMEKTFYENL